MTIGALAPTNNTLALSLFARTVDARVLGQSRVDAAPAAMEVIAAAVARGTLAPAEAAELAKVVDTFANAIELRYFDSRLRALEEQS